MPADSKPAHFHSTSEAASAIGVAAETVVEWAKRGRLPVFATVGLRGDRIFDPGDVERVARERARDSKKPSRETVAA